MPFPELVIFDCDGVLIDSEVLAHQALVETLEEYGIHITLDEALKKYAGVSTASETADISKRFKKEFPAEYAQKKNARRAKLFEENLQAIPGIFELLDDLPYKKCIASSSSFPRLKESLGLVGLWDRFAPHIFSAEQVKNGKPAPDLFLFAAEQMGVHPAQCLVIEDSIAGMQAAHSAGMRAFGFVGGSHCGAGQTEALMREGAEQVFADMSLLAEALLQAPASYEEGLSPLANPTL